jgi:hypothetical protein
MLRNWFPISNLAIRLFLVARFNRQDLAAFAENYYQE